MFKRISEKSVTFAKQLSENKQIFQSIFTKTAAPPSLPPSYNYSRMISSSSHCSTLRSRAGEQASYIVHHHHLNGGLFPVRLFSSAAAAAAAPVLSLRDLHSSSFTTPHFPLRLGPLHQYAARKPRFVSTTASSNEQPVSSPRNKDDIEEEHQPPFLAPPRPRSSPGVKQAREMHAVNVAVAVNIAIFFAKVATWSVTRSGALLAEALHSFADIANQLLLRAGVEQSRRPATRQHPYGFHREKYIYALMSAVGVFCLGAGASVIHGIQSLLDPPALQNMGYSLAVLSLSSLAEMYSLRVAYSAVRIGAKEQGQAILPYLMSSNDPTTAAVLAEDAGAVAGLGIAGVASYMTYVTGDPLYDALGSIAVGCLMGAVAVTLIRNNKKFLIGQAMRPEMHAAIVAHLDADPTVLAVIDAKSEEIGDGVYRFKADIQWSGDRIVKKYLSSLGREPLYKQIRDSAVANTPQPPIGTGGTSGGGALLDADPNIGSRDDEVRAATDIALMEFGRGVIRTVGEEIDRLEVELRSLCPGLQFVDLETDRGRSDQCTGTAERVVGAVGGGGEEQLQPQSSSSGSNGGGSGSPAAAGAA